MTEEIKICHNSNHRERKEKIRYIIIHCSKFPPSKQIEILNEYGLSTHYIVSQSGEVVENCSPEYVAYHAGESHWQKSELKSLNEVSIGIEIEAPTLGQKKEDYPPIVIKRLCELLHSLKMRYQIRPEDIIGHSDIAPTRKIDPGAGFPWLLLYKNDFGVWPSMKSLHKEEDEATLLQIIGYDTTDMVATRYAFCRHFIPEETQYNSNLQELLDNPYPKDFQIRNQERYKMILRATAQAYESARQKRYWYIEK